MTDFTPWTAADAARWIAVPDAASHKYSRGVLGVVTGSEQYPGAAVLGVEAALRTGVGMVRYLGPERPTALVLQRRPEAVVVDGRVQAWLVGSGMDPVDRDSSGAERVLAQGLPVVLDGGALDLRGSATGPVVLTPHHRELARLLRVDAEDVVADPAGWASRASRELDATVLLKGGTTHIAGGDTRLSVTGAPAWLATAGAGDALGGILGALVATHDASAEGLPELAATAAFVHGRAAVRASGGGPFTILDLCEAIPGVVAELISRGNG